MEGGGVTAAPDAAAAAAAAPARAFTMFGIELEYMIVDAASLDVQPVADLVLRRLHGDGGPVVNDVARGGLGWSNELVLHLLELKNPRPTSDLAALAAKFQAEVRAIRPILAEFGARLMPGGMHPWMDPRTETELWPHDGQAIYNAYDRIFDCRRHGWANVQAMHVNLPFAGDEEFEHLHAAVRALLPIVPAVAASSPFTEGRVAGALDYRMEVYRTSSARIPALTGHVVPENYSTRAQYEETLLRPMYAAIGEHDPKQLLQDEWLNSRGAIARFDRSAIELRVVDVQEHPGADIAIAALVADTAWWLNRSGPPLAEQQALDTTALAQVLQACCQDGERTLIDYAPLLRLFGVRADECSAAELWDSVAQRLEAAGAPHRTLWRARLQQILAHGTLARRLLRAASAQPGREELAGIYRALCDCLDGGRDFAP